MNYIDAVKWPVLILLCISTVTAEVYSCGGFVKSPDVPIDYSEIQVRLFTTEGNLKFETECSPTNGYYMIPVYSKGDYSIRIFAPDGWFFQPSSFDLKVDGKNDLCSKGEDINFVLNAFAVEGVLRSGNGNGPAGVTLVLIAENGTLISETKTVANGAYRFRASPGKYLVSTAGNSTECIERDKVPVSITTSPVHVSPDLKISGHLLTVSVLSKKHQVAGVSVALYSKTVIKLTYCNEKLSVVEKEGKKLDRKLVCKIKTDIDGIAHFPCLPPGLYTIQPTLFTDKVRFSFSPEMKEITMGSSAEQVIFDTLGFSSKGQVLLSGQPVIDAVVYVNGEMKGKTDANGWYTLDGLQDEDYTISAKKDHFIFNTVNIKLTAKKAEIPDIVAESVEVCVTVNAEENISGVMSIIFTNQQMKAVRSVNRKSNGKMCNLQKIGRYIVSVSTVNGVVMTPKQHEIDLSKGPALDVVFNQFKIDVNVSVVCIDDCGTLKIELWKEKILIKSLEGIDQFIFHQVTPDSYKLKMVDNGRFCWEKTEMDIVVESPDLNYLIFRQVGYRTATRLSHPAKAKWSMLEKPQISDSLDVPAGQFSFCIPLAGIYTVIFEACHKFDKQSYEISIPQEVPLVVSVSKFLLSASIELDQTRNKHDDFFLFVSSSTNEQTIPVTFSTAEKLTFTFYLSTLDADALVTLTPQSKTYLFTPTSHIFRFTGECRLDEIIFKADKGIFLEGQVVPAVEGVNIRSSHKSNPNSILESITDVNGKFRMGPVRSVNDFDIIAEKSGYKFERTEELGKLNAIKLSQLIIITTDAETGEPLTNVLISLSGVENYRSNNFIDKTGKITFVGLQPGEYFLRPILQEYRFDPKSVTLNIKEGEFETVNLKGYRFAYSTLGKVSYPAGQPVIGMIVEAVSEQCNQLQEDDTTNETGEYRIRGLHPKCIYRLVLKTPNGQRLQSYPTHYNIMVNTEDIKDIDFVLTHIDERVDVAGNVVFVDINSPPQYKVGLYKSGNLVQQATVIAPSTVFYFEIPTVDNVAYSVRFETTYGVGNQRLDAAEVFFTANETFKAVSLSVLAQRKSEVEISGGSYFALPFFFLIAYLFFNHQKATSFTEEIFVRLSNISSSQHSLSPGDDYADAARKRQNSRKNQGPKILLSLIFIKS
ncbi:Nicotinic receptor-associated protein [Dirofilaria immitis]